MQHVNGKAPPMAQMHAGDKHVYQVHGDVHDLVEAAGSKAARRKSVARNQTRYHSLHKHICPADI
jgi:hypothetical protein